jgi:hypothetical protein
VREKIPDDLTKADRRGTNTRIIEFSKGSWLCKNVETVDDDRTNYASKTVRVLKFESTLNLKTELKNVILTAFQSFAFLHSQGHNRKFGDVLA